MMKQKGFTLVELLVALAITGILLLVLVLTIHSILVNTTNNNDKVVVLSNVDRAALYIRRDLQQAQDTDLPEYGAPQSSCTLTWIDITGFTTDNSTSHSCTYALVDTNLERSYDGITSIIARQIEDIEFCENGSFIDIAITSADSVSLRQPSKTLNFSINMRGEEIP